MEDRRRPERLVFIGVRIIPYHNERLEEVARRTGKKKSELVRDAIHMYLGYLQREGIA